MTNIEDFQFANQMYTKISDIKNNLKDQEKLRYNPNDNLEDKIKYNIKNSNNINNINTDLDFLLYEEKYDIKKTPKISKIKNKVKVEKTFTNKFYILIFILFFILNSYYVINFINSKKIQYNTSLIIRSILFILLIKICNYMQFI